ncbi:MAG TPA: TIGR04086 family membrane protein [Actinomycetota bacterium]|nr:TIGR04086 family membrane protein [Actinomycetota bacterium]
MFGRRRDDSHADSTKVARRDAVAARGGVSFGAVLTGTLVAFGAMFVLTAVISGILVGLGLSEDLTPGEATEVGVATGVGLVVAQFVSYMWGGYAAGRMSRGAGSANGALVALLGIVVGIAVGAIAAGIGATEDLRTPFNSSQLPADGEVLRWGAGLAIAALAAMFFGSIVGGTLGARWHTKLERRAVAEHDERDRRVVHTDAEEDRRTGSGRETIDLRDSRRADSTVTTPGRRE